MSDGLPPEAPPPLRCRELFRMTSKLSGSELQERLVRCLLGGERRCERRDRRAVGRPRSDALSASFIELRRLLQTGLRGRVSQAAAKLGRLFDRGCLRLLEDLGVLDEFGGRLSTGLAPDEFPGAVDDFLLELRQLVGLLGVARFALLLVRPGPSPRGAARPGGRSPRNAGPRRRTCRPRNAAAGRPDRCPRPRRSR